MRKLGYLLVALALTIGASSAFAQSQAPSKATAEFKTAVGETIGNATLTQNADGSVFVQVKVRGLPQGVHGIHIHSVGACSPDFAAAGAHYNPLSKQHGFDNPAGPHAGDLPNLNIAADGTGTLDFTTSMVTLTPGAATLFDADGSAFIIHAYTDDQKTDPAGNSGLRIACAVITPVAVAQPAQPTAQPGAAAGGTPQHLPNTGGNDAPWLLLILATTLLVSGALALRRVRG